MHSSPRASTSHSAYGSSINGGATSSNASHSRGPSSARGREGIINEKERPRILLMGPRSGGKSSIHKVVFEGMAPSDTLFIEKTAKSTIDDSNAFVSIQMWDFPSGQLDPDQWNLPFSELDSIVFVLDAQSAFNDTVRKLAMVIEKAFQVKKTMEFEVFLHKIDGMSHEYRLDTMQNLRDRLGDELYDISPELESGVPVFYHFTSIFDITIYEALSRVIQKLLPEQGMLERLLDALSEQCKMRKVFLIDTSSKLFIATDSTPVESDNYVICSDYIDLVGDFTHLYEPHATGTPRNSRSPSTGSRSNALTPLGRLDAPSPSRTNVVVARAPSSDAGIVAEGQGEGRTKLASSKAKLSGGVTIAQWGISLDLSIIALIAPGMVDQHAALIDYNVATFREAVLDIFQLGLVK